MKTIRYCVVGIFLAGCLFMSSGMAEKKIESNRKDPVKCLKYEGEWSSNFKDMVFLNCLYCIYPKEFGNMIVKNDNSNAANMEWLNYDLEISKVVRDIAEDFAKKPEAKWDIEGKKVTMNICLDFRMSAELDSITGVYYKKYNPGK